MAHPVQATSILWMFTSGVVILGEEQQALLRYGSFHLTARQMPPGYLRCRWLKCASLKLGRVIKTYSAVCETETMLWTPLIATFSTKVDFLTACPNRKNIKVKVYLMYLFCVCGSVLPSYYFFSTKTHPQPFLCSCAKIYSEKWKIVIVPWGLMVHFLILPDIFRDLLWTLRGLSVFMWKHKFITQYLMILFLEPMNSD